MLDGISPANSEGLITLGYQPWTDYTVTAPTTILQDATLTNREGSIVFRYNGPADFYWAGLGSYNNFIAIGRMVGGVDTKLAGVGLDTDVAFNRTYNLKVVMKGSLIQVFVDDALQLEFTDATFASGGVGFRVWNSHAQFASVDVSSPSPIPLLPIALGLLGVGAIYYITRR